MMEFFTCSCPGKGTVMLDGADQGLNKDEAGDLAPKKANEGLHKISLSCVAGRKCRPRQRKVWIKDTDPILPLEVFFKCAALRKSPSAL